MHRCPALVFRRSARPDSGTHWFIGRSQARVTRLPPVTSSESFRLTQTGEIGQSGSLARAGFTNGTNWPGENGELLGKNARTMR